MIIVSYVKYAMCLLELIGLYFVVNSLNVSLMLRFGYLNRTVCASMVGLLLCGVVIRLELLISLNL